MKIKSFIFAATCLLAATAQADQKSDVINYFNSSQEKWVFDSVWATDQVLRLGMLNNGTPRDGFAQYACEVIYGFGYRGSKVWIQIIDIAKLKRTGKWEKMGEARCL